MALWIFAALVFFGARGARAQCVSSGRFANELAAECRGYTTCIAAGAASYRYDLTCPPGFLYHHLDSQCTNASDYRCLPAARCERPGAFPAPEAADCRSYVACFPGLEGVQARLVACAPGSLFNPAQQFCVNEDQYSCPAPVTAPTPTPPATAPEVTTAKPSSSPSIKTDSLFFFIVLFVFTTSFV